MITTFCLHWNSKLCDQHYLTFISKCENIFQENRICLHTCNTFNSQTNCKRTIIGDFLLWFKLTWRKFIHSFISIFLNNVDIFKSHDPAMIHNIHIAQNFCVMFVLNLVHSSFRVYLTSNHAFSRISLSCRRYVYVIVSFSDWVVRYN